MGKDSNGCIAGILIFAFIAGNIFLFNGLDNVSDNPFAIVLLIFAVVADIFVVGYLIRIAFTANTKEKSDNIDNGLSKTYENTLTDQSSKDANVSSNNPVNKAKPQTAYKTTSDTVTENIKTETEFSIPKPLNGIDLTLVKGIEVKKDATPPKTNIDDKKAKVQETFDLSWVNVGSKVKHKNFGIGVVVSITNDTIKIQFDKIERVFFYPGVFKDGIVTKATERDLVSQEPLGKVIRKGPDWVKIGVIVCHKIFGKGTIISIADNSITVKFGTVDKEFAYPNVFEDGHLCKSISESSNQKETLKSNASLESKNGLEKTENTTKTVEIQNKSNEYSSNSKKASEEIMWGEVELPDEKSSIYQSQAISKPSSISPIDELSREIKLNMLKSSLRKKKEQSAASSNTKKTKTNVINKKNPVNLPVIKMIRNMEKIKIDSQILYPKKFYSRYKVEDEEKARRALLFYKQAQYMEKVEDYYYADHEDTYLSSWPDFKWMSDEDLRGYFSWRTKVRKDKKITAKVRYVQIYLSELINNIPRINDDRERLTYFINFISNIGCYVEEESWQLNYYHVRQWLIDFYLLNNSSWTPEEFNNLLPEQFQLRTDKYIEVPASRKYSDSRDLINKVSHYKFLTSSFYKSEYGYLLLEAMDVVFAEVELYLKKYRINWFNVVFSSCETILTNRQDWFPFGGLTYYPGPTIADIDVRLVNGDRYRIKDGKGYKWHCISSLNPYADAIAYTIKLVENELRKALGYRSKLKPNAATICSHLNYYEKLKPKYENKLKVFSTEEYRDIVVAKTNEFFDSKEIDRMIMSKAYQQKKEKEKKRAEKAKLKAETETPQVHVPVVVDIDRSKFASIRKVSEEIQDVLIVENDDLSESSDTYISNDNSPVVETESKVFQEQEGYELDNEYVVLIRSLTELEKDLLVIILEANPESLNEMNSLVIKNNDLLETVVDRINQKALEIIGDNIIEFLDLPVVYEDYSDGLKEVLGEE